MDSTIIGTRPATSAQDPSPIFKRRLIRLAAHAGYLVDWLPGNMVRLTDAETGADVVLTSLAAASLLRHRLAVQRQNRGRHRRGALH